MNYPFQIVQMQQRPAGLGAVSLTTAVPTSSFKGLEEIVTRRTERVFDARALPVGYQSYPRT
jgi:hypothetical protein